MRRRKVEMTSVYGGDGKKVDSYVSRYGYVNIPRFKHKKKSISMIKALEVRDKMERRKVFYNSETWKEIRKDHFKNTIFLGEEGGSDIGIQSNHSLPD